MSFIIGSIATPLKSPCDHRERGRSVRAKRVCESERGVSRASIVSGANGKATSRRKTRWSGAKATPHRVYFYYAWIGYSDALFLFFHNYSLSLFSIF